MGISQDAKTLEGDHHIARPAVKTMDDDHVYFPCRNILQQLLEGWTLLDLLATCPPLIINVKYWGEDASPLTFLCNTAFLRIHTEILFLHMARTTNVASNHQCGSFHLWRICVQHGKPLPFYLYS